MSTWQPIETLDDCDREVLLWTPPQRVYSAEQLAAFPDLPGDMRVQARRYFIIATHWMPLPDPPVSSPQTPEERT